MVDPNGKTPVPAAFAFKQLLHSPLYVTAETVSPNYSMGGGLWTAVAFPLSRIVGMFSLTLRFPLKNRSIWDDRHHSWRCFDLVWDRAIVSEMYEIPIVCASSRAVSKSTLIETTAPFIAENSDGEAAEAWKGDEDYLGLLSGESDDDVDTSRSALELGESIAW